MYGGIYIVVGVVVFIYTVWFGVIEGIIIVGVIGCYGCVWGMYTGVTGYYGCVGGIYTGVIGYTGCMG